MFSNHFDDIYDYPSDEGLYLDVPFVPTEEDVVDAMLELAHVGPKDILYDLGSGDGRILISAAKEWGTRGIGIDIDPVRIADAMEFAGWSQVVGIVDFIEGDFFSEDFSEATVVSLYLLQSINLQLRPRLLSELRPGSRIVSHAFDMGDWKPDDYRKIGTVNIYKWIVPANVAGTWKWEHADRRYRIDLHQSFQQVSGNAWLDGKKVQLKSANLSGRRLTVEIQEEPDKRPATFMFESINDRLRLARARTGRT